MQRFKKPIFTVITLVLALAIVGCAGDDSTSTTTATTTAATTTTTTVATVVPDSLVGTYSQVILDITADLGVMERDETLSGIECTTFADVTITLASDGTFSSTIRNSYSYEIPASMASLSSTLQDVEVETKEEGTVEVFDEYIKATSTKMTETRKIGSASPTVVTSDVDNVKYALYDESWISFDGTKFYNSTDQLVDLIPGDYFQGGIAGVGTFDDVQYVQVEYDKLTVTSITDVDVYSMSYYLKVGATDGKKYVYDQATFQMVEAPTVEYELQMPDISLESSATGVYSFTVDFGGGDIDVPCYQYSDRIEIFMEGTSEYISSSAFEYESYITAPSVNIGTLDPTDVVIYTLNEEGTQVISTVGSTSTILDASNDEYGLNVVYKANDKFNIRNLYNSYIYETSKNLALSTNEAVSASDGFFLGAYTVVITEDGMYNFEVDSDWSSDVMGDIQLSIVDSEGLDVYSNSGLSMSTYLEAGTYTFAVIGVLVDSENNRVYDTLEFTFNVSKGE